MSGVGRVGSDAAGGTIVSSPQSKATAHGKPIVVVGSKVAPHGDGEHAHAVMVQGSSKVTINGIAVCRAGDKASCGHSLGPGDGSISAD